MQKENLGFALFLTSMALAGSVSAYEAFKPVNESLKITSQPQESPSDPSTDICPQVLISKEFTPVEILPCYGILISQDIPNVRLVALKGDYDAFLSKLGGKVYKVRFYFDTRHTGSINIISRANINTLKIPLRSDIGDRDLSIYVQAALMTANEVQFSGIGPVDLSPVVDRHYKELSENPENIIFEFKTTGIRKQD